ncbi:hypothetical protein MUN81_10940 [Hymenobacter sp. 5317J-9]|uniref:hypothetical protein n=1 Tax=Hymenobacter sp. 5317J-9 TaxID=2932250 RepID=UPI001FD67770|nr:hypothetical protein [Hymenobacter sp. 5317J-9]UOQ99993.1 hypothetical protein MUN81_10940 [Hymenobacter sp. 5317J-9]
MKAILLLLCLLVGLALPGFAQGRDTVFAVHKLFREKRGSGEAWTATGLTATAGTAMGSPLYTPPQPNGSDVASAAVMGGVPMAVGLLQMGRFSPAREAEVLKLYAEGWGLPRDIRRRLKRRHFKMKANDIQRKR